MHLQERREKAISNALNKLCNPDEDISRYWFNEVDMLIEFEFYHCSTDTQKAQVIVEWVRLCENLKCPTVKEEIMKRYNK